uniref:VWFC domain-containing protein n=1 Tax=Megaselia scalaris TaxID=36166 RepID=T1GF20_MEGSC
MDGQGEGGGEEQICPSTENCYTVLKNQPGSCCKRCKECLYKNVTYQSGDEWEDPGDPCLKLKCLSGVVTKTVIKCYQHCDASNFLPPKEGQCCGTCLALFSFYSFERDVQSFAV